MAGGFEGMVPSPEQVASHKYICRQCFKYTENVVQKAIWNKIHLLAFN